MSADLIGWQPLEVLRPDWRLAHEEVELLLGLLDSLRRPLAWPFKAAFIEAFLRPERYALGYLGRNGLNLLDADAREGSIYAA